MSKENQGISLATFALSTLISLATYLISSEPFSLALIVLIVLTCAALSWLPNLDGDYTRYKRREMEPPINPDNPDNGKSWLDEIREMEVSYEITLPKNKTYAQQLAFDPCPQS